MKTTLKMAVAVCGFVGSISYNPGVEIEYLEDDELFGKTSVQQASGWSWGLSSAHALGCQSTLSCGYDQSNDDGAWEDAQWARYDECIATAQTPEEEQACESIIAGL